jgi:ribosomal protein S18 acetylase RimI-like enzyme
MQTELLAPNDELRDFVRRHGVLDWDEETIAAIVTGLAHDRMLVVRDGSALVLVGCLLHDLGNPDGASEIIPLACLGRERMPEALAALVTEGERRLLGYGTKRIEIQVPPKLGGVEPVLEAVGYHCAWENVDLELAPLGAHRPVRHGLPTGAAWCELGEHTLLAAFACYQRALRTVPGAQVPPFEDFARIIPTLLPLQRLLMRDGQVLAFTRVGWKDQARATGEIFTLGRDPDAHLPGLGALALLEAVRVLGELGATRAELTMSSRNLLAMGLYARFGFVTKGRRAVLQKDLSPALRASL